MKICCSVLELNDLGVFWYGVNKSLEKLGTLIRDIFIFSHFKINFDYFAHGILSRLNSMRQEHYFDDD